MMVSWFHKKDQGHNMFNELPMLAVVVLACIMTALSIACLPGGRSRMSAN